MDGEGIHSVDRCRRKPSHVRGDCRRRLEVEYPPPSLFPMLLLEAEADVDVGGLSRSFREYSDDNVYFMIIL